jgi:CHRD domain
MKSFSLSLVALALVSLVQLKPVSAAMTSVTIPLSAQNGSGESGTAKISDVDGGVTVVISLKGPATAQPAHIHDGSCPNPGGVVFPLNDVVGGSSTTPVKGTSVAALMQKPYSINVHESAANLGKYVACGNIKAVQPM